MLNRTKCGPFIILDEKIDLREILRDNSVNCNEKIAGCQKLDTQIS